MNSISCANLNLSPFFYEGKRFISNNCKQVTYVFDKHSDLVKSVGILTITTSLLAEKILKGIPPLVPRIGLVILNYAGIININMEIRDLLKSVHDFGYAFKSGDYSGILETAVKVAFKAANLLMMGVAFGASIIAVCGYPQLTLAIYIAMRPYGLTSLVLSILSNVRDYFVNKALLQEMHRVEHSSKTGREIAKTMVCFLEIILKQETTLYSKAYPNERLLAERLVRQLDPWMLETFREKLQKPHQVENIRQETERVFFVIHDSIEETQSATKANLFLTSLGYASMAICKAFPDTILEMSTRWGMSVLYNDQLIIRKLRQANAAAKLS